jgi:hypothetical protein
MSLIYDKVVKMIVTGSKWMLPRHAKDHMNISSPRSPKIAASWFVSSSSVSTVRVTSMSKTWHVQQVSSQRDIVFLIRMRCQPPSLVRPEHAVSRNMPLRFHGFRRFSFT